MKIKTEEFSNVKHLQYNGYPVDLPFCFEFYKERKIKRFQNTVTYWLAETIWL